jgi:hypothetical protein
MRALAHLLLLALSTPVAVVAQTIYKCTESGGTTVYSEHPCSTDAAKIETIETVVAETASTRDALAEQSEFVRLNDVRRQCDAQIESVANRYGAQLRRVANDIARLEAQIKAVDYRLRGTNVDTELRRQIPELEKERARLKDAQAAEVSSAREQCRNEVQAEEDRQSAARAVRAEAAKAEAARAEAQRAAEKAAADRAAEEQAKSDDE